MNLYEHCIGEKQKSATVYMVAYVNWKGQWTLDEKEFKSEASAKKHSKKIAKEKAENGRVSIRLMPKSKTERTKLQKNIGKF